MQCWGCGVDCELDWSMCVWCLADILYTGVSLQLQLSSTTGHRSLAMLLVIVEIITDKIHINTHLLTVSQTSQNIPNIELSKAQPVTLTHLDWQKWDITGFVFSTSYITLAWIQTVQWKQNEFYTTILYDFKTANIYRIILEFFPLQSWKLRHKNSLGPTRQFTCRAEAWL